MVDVEVSSPADESVDPIKLQELLQNALDKATVDGKLSGRDVDPAKETTVDVPVMGMWCDVYSKSLLS